jgi:hypothetical protein
MSPSPLPSGQAYSRHAMQDDELLSCGKYMYDVIEKHLAANDFFEIQNKWCAFRLSDGKGDGTLYDTKADAIQAQYSEYLAVFISFRNLMSGSSAEELAVVMKFHRDAYRAGMRINTDPNASQDLIMTPKTQDIYRPLQARLRTMTALRQGGLIK